MASTDATAIPIKNQAYRVTFPILDADGDLVTGATGLDSEISKDAGTFADCTNEATEIATSSGMYYLDLTSTEMNADCVAIIVKTSSSGAKTTPIVLYPAEAADIKVNVVAYGGTAGTFASGRPEVNTTHIAGSAVSTSSAQLGVNVVNFGGSAGTFASGRPEVNTSHIAGSAVSTSSAQIGVNVVNAGGTAWGSGAITAASIATDAITAAKIAPDAIGASELASDAGTEIATAVWANGTRTLSAATNITSTGGTTVPQTGDNYARIGAPVGASISADVAAVKADTVSILSKLLKYVQLIVRKDSAIATDNSTELTAINANGGSGAGAYANTTDALEALRDNVGTAGAGLTAVVWNASWDAEVQSEVQDALDAVLADSVPSDGTRPSIAQAIYMMIQFLFERGVSGTTLTVNKVDGVTPLMTFTLGDATTPTTITRTT